MRSTIVLCCSLGVLTATAAPESAAECNRYRSTADTTKLQISSDWRTVDQYPVTDRAKTFDLRTCGTSIVGVCAVDPEGKAEPFHIITIHGTMMGDDGPARDFMLVDGSTIYEPACE